MTDYQLWHGDCLEEMDRIEAGSVDAIICDLPYGGVTACKWDVVIPFEPLWKQYKRVIKKNGAIVLFGSEPFSSLLRLSNLDWYKYDWVWDKKLAANYLAASKMPLMIHEGILVFSAGGANNGAKNPMIYNPQMVKRQTPRNGTLNDNSENRQNPKYHHLRGREKINTRWDARFPVSIIECGNTTRQSKAHPTQKPVALLSYLIKTYTNEGETVLDNTFGSCSTGEAAIRLGRRFIGIERDANYFRIGQERMERVAAELRGELNHLPMFAEVAA